MERLRFELRAPPWNATGRQPFGWELIPACGNQPFPTVRIVAGREVTISRTRNPGGGRSRATALDVLDTDNPAVEVIRLQNDALLPDLSGPCLFIAWCVGLIAFIKAWTRPSSITVISVRFGKRGRAMTLACHANPGRRQDSP